MQQFGSLNEEILQNKILERRNDELLMLLEAWHSKSQSKTLSFVKTLHLHEIENLVIRYFQVYNVPVSLYDEDGKLLFSIGWKDVCLKYHKNILKNLNAFKESVKKVNNRMADINSFSFKCKNNINSVAIPIIIQRQNLGTLVVNQFLFEDELVDAKTLKEFTYHNGLNYEEYKQAYEELPVLSLEEVEKMTEQYILLSEMISFIASHNLQVQDHQIGNKERTEMFKVFKEKLDEQSLLLKSLNQFLIQQTQEIEHLKNEINLLRKKSKSDLREKNLVEE